MRKYVLAIAVTLFGGAQIPLSAQVPSHHTGLQMAVGLGAGVADIAKCANCVSEGTNTSVTAFFRLGGTMSPEWLASIEVGGWYRSSGGSTAGLVSFSALGTFYPMENGFKVNGGIGGLLFREEFAPNDNTANGVMWRIGVGYDVPLKEAMSVSPFVEVLYGPELDQKHNRLATFNDVRLFLVQIGVSVVGH